MTLKELLKIYPQAGIIRASRFLPHLVAAMAAYEINSKARKTAFLAQVGHESEQLIYVRELASGKAYEGRLDLGNTEPGDGVRFRGRGLIQITGRENYLKCSLSLFGDDRLIQFPELLEDPAYACKSAGWFWHVRGLNALADVNDLKSFKRITKIINGGYTHLDRRVALYESAKEHLA